MPERHANARTYGRDTLDGYRQSEHQYRKQPRQTFQHRGKFTASRVMPWQRKTRFLLQTS